MMMRRSLSESSGFSGLSFFSAIFAGLVAPSVLSACDDGGAASSGPKAIVKVSAMTHVADIEVCVSLVIRDAAGAVTFSAGESASSSAEGPATAAAARADGALCGASAFEAGATCRPGPAKATLHLLGIWAADGTRFDINAPCGAAGCLLDFTCSAEQDVPIEFHLTILPNASQGFFDVAFEVPPPEGAPELCYALRLVNGDGVEVFARADICSSKYGNSAGGTVTYIMPCDAQEGFENNVLTWWVQAPAIPNAEGWTHPCLAPADAPADLAQWAGGCIVAQACEQNRDIAIRVGNE